MAHEIVNLEKPARNRELELKRRVEVGLTKEQEENVTLMAGLRAKYPDAFIGHVDDKGREVLVLAYRIPSDIGKEEPSLERRVFVFTQNGAFGIKETPGKGWTVWNDLDFNQITDAISNISSPFPQGKDLPGVGMGFDKLLADVKKFSLEELGSDRIAKRLSEVLAFADKTQRIERERAAQRIPTVETILSKL